MRRPVASPPLNLPGRCLTDRFGCRCCLCATVGTMPVAGALWWLGRYDDEGGDATWRETNLAAMASSLYTGLSQRGATYGRKAR